MSVARDADGRVDVFAWAGDDLPDRFGDLVRRMYERAYGRGSPYAAIVAAGDSDEEQRLSVDDDGLVALAATALEGSGGLLCPVEYPLLRGEVKPVDLRLFGRHHGDGATWRTSGPVSVSIAACDLFFDTDHPAPPDSQLIGRGLPPSDYWSELGSDWTDLVQAEAEDLFRWTTGRMNYVSGQDFDHAAMYVNSVWWSPIGATMFYHRRARECARDFVRIHAAHVTHAHPSGRGHGSSVYTPMTYGRDGNPWKLIRRAQAGTTSETDDIDRDDRDDSGSADRGARSLLSALDEDLVKRLSRATAGETQDALWDRPFSWTVYPVCDVGLDAFVVGRLFEGVWPFYADLAAALCKHG